MATESEKIMKEITKLHEVITKISERRKEFASKIDELRSKLSDELISELENNTNNGASKTKQHIVNLERDLVDLEQAGIKALNRKQSEIQKYYDAIVSENESKMLEFQKKSNEFWDKEVALKKRYEAETKQLRDERVKADHDANWRKYDADKARKYKPIRSFKSQDVSSIDDASSDPFSVVLPWVWESTISELKKKEKQHIGDFKAPIRDSALYGQYEQRYGEIVIEIDENGTVKTASYTPKTQITRY